MGRPLIGDVIVIPFPFADLTGYKRRPAVVIGYGEHAEDVILCQITSKQYASESIPLLATDFESGGLPGASFVRPLKVFTGSADLLERTAGRVTPSTLTAIRQRLSHRLAD